MKKKLGQEPTFPTPDYILQNSGELNYNPVGISKRLYIATMATQGILSNNEITVKNAKDYAEMSFVLLMNY